MAAKTTERDILDQLHRRYGRTTMGARRYGCARLEDEDPNVRCGYYRRYHPTMGCNDA